MPTYEYKCDACGATLEKFQPITATALKKCPKCGKSRLRRLISAGGGVIFKGSGFYATDYRSEAYKTAAKGDSGAGGGNATKPAGADAKPAASEAKPAATEAAKKDVSVKGEKSEKRKKG